MKELQRFMDYVNSWATAVFGQRSGIEQMLKLKEEADELIEAIEHINADPDLTDFEKRKLVEDELADIFIILLDTAKIRGFTFEQVYHAAQDKMLVNSERKWIANGDGTYSHDDSFRRNDLPF